MNRFDLKVALLEKQAQDPVIKPHTHGVEQGPNVWLTNFKLPPSRVCCEEWPCHLLASALLFLTTKGISHAVFSLEICTPDYWRS